MICAVIVIAFERNIIDLIFPFQLIHVGHCGERLSEGRPRNARVAYFKKFNVVKKNKEISSVSFDRSIHKVFRSFLNASFFFCARKIVFNKT
jgi:hypothetical protein